MTINIRCIYCDSKDVVKTGRQANGTPRRKCKNCGKTFQTEYVSNGAKLKTKELRINMSLNGGRICDISRFLGVRTNTVLGVLKTKKKLTNINLKHTNNSNH